MSIKTKLKKRLLEIPINDCAIREKHRLASDLDIDLKYIEFYLNELVLKNILKQKFEYRCPNCGEVTTMDDELLSEVLEDGFFGCDNCFEFINPNKSKTGYIFYDIRDKQALIAW